jgi:hypothetical protein
VAASRCGVRGGGVVSTYEALIAERYSDPTWFPKPDTKRAEDDEVTCRRRLAACVAEFDAVVEGRGKWTTKRGIKVWEASA